MSDLKLCLEYLKFSTQIKKKLYSDHADHLSMDVSGGSLKVIDKYEQIIKAAG
jgi:hypothetical protein